MELLLLYSAHILTCDIDTCVVWCSAVTMPTVQGNDDDASSDCSDLSTASSFEDEDEEDASEIDPEFEIINGSFTLCSIIIIIIIVIIIIPSVLCL